MIKPLLLTTAIVMGYAATCETAKAGPLDRIEDRLDRRESYIDRQTDRGPLDRIEDRVDFVESRLDRRGIELTPRIDRHERRKIRYLRHVRSADE